MQNFKGYNVTNDYSILIGHSALFRGHFCNLMQKYFLRGTAHRSWGTQSGLCPMQAQRAPSLSPLAFISRDRDVVRGGGLIWCFDALFEDGQHKVEKACVMCFHWGTWKESPGPRARGECCRWIWGPPRSRTVAPLMPDNPFSMTFIFLKSATPPQHHVWLNLWRI